MDLYTVYVRWGEEGYYEFEQIDICADNEECAKAKARYILMDQYKPGWTITMVGPCPVATIRISHL
jgi:hypothetical protein